MSLNYVILMFQQPSHVTDTHHTNSVCMINHVQKWVCLLHLINCAHIRESKTEIKAKEKLAAEKLRLFPFLTSYFHNVTST